MRCRFVQWALVDVEIVDAAAVAAAACDVVSRQLAVAVAGICTMLLAAVVAAAVDNTLTVTLGASGNDRHWNRACVGHTDKRDQRDESTLMDDEHEDDGSMMRRLHRVWH